MGRHRQRYLIKLTAAVGEAARVTGSAKGDRGASRRQVQGACPLGGGPSGQPTRYSWSPGSNWIPGGPRTKVAAHSRSSPSPVLVCVPTPVAALSTNTIWPACDLACLCVVCLDAVPGWPQGTGASSPFNQHSGSIPTPMALPALGIEGITGILSC